MRRKGERVREQKAPVERPGHEKEFEEKDCVRERKKG